MQMTRALNSRFENQIDKIKEANNQRVFQYFVEHNTANVFAALKNVTKFLRLQRAKTVEFQNRITHLRAKNAINLCF